MQGTVRISELEPGAVMGSGSGVRQCGCGRTFELLGLMDVEPQYAVGTLLGARVEVVQRDCGK
jgi:hypothetical protein